MFAHLQLGSAESFPFSMAKPLKESMHFCLYFPPMTSRVMGLVSSAVSVEAVWLLSTSLQLTQQLLSRFTGSTW